MKITKILVLSRKNINISYPNKRLWIMDHVVLNWLLISRGRNHCHWTYSFGVTQLRNWYFWRLECLLPYFSVGSCASHGGIEKVPSNGSSVRDGVFHPVRSESVKVQVNKLLSFKHWKVPWPRELVVNSQTTNNLEYVVNFMRCWPIFKVPRGPIINNNIYTDVSYRDFSDWSGFGIIKQNREGPTRSFSGGIQFIIL